VEKYFEVFTDGGSRGNPGPAGAGVVIRECMDQECKNIIEKYKFLGEVTNNQAEYRALLMALEELTKLNIVDEINFYLDSKLVVEQVNGNYKMKNPGLMPLFQEVKERLSNLKVKTIFTYIPRERNKLADKLANIAMDEGASFKG
jgi:probable phosphoglycerate mutase